MKKLKIQLENAVKLLSGYDGTEPFHLYLNRQFKANRNYGSADRKFYKQACFSFWRNAAAGSAINTRNVASALWGQADYQELLQELFNEHGWPVPATHGEHCVTEKVVPFLSKKIPYADYATWFRTMPPVYLVPFPGKSEKLRKELNELGVAFEEDGIFFKAQNSPLIQVCTNKGLCRIQDKASALSMMDLPVTSGSKVWDCCSGAGGKALLLRQVYPEIELFCSDKRKNILDNLNQRFELAGMPAPNVAAVDLSEDMDQLEFPGFRIQGPYFDVVIADVPCSGSGTWRHNPEQAHFFEPDKLLNIQSLQKQIIRHAVSFLKPQGLLVYVTCSVFECENEEMAEWCSTELGLDHGFQGYLGRKAENADYMFRAVFRKKLNQMGS